ncbi:hypothetical protein NLI96_g1937 [Meripilus lineatus]|uniref:Uncharacterized protein n=1 Tax=Meripilus lineatus TaxID=2056292 RepID=A0AAD5YH13_9APHY|nr:hypothetical protein NLI96_g1937 [Physisporinus lineatus]
MNTAPSPSRQPPPRMPSPQPVHNPLPPPFPRRVSSRSRLQLPLHPEEPPIPPSLIGSPILQRFTSNSRTQPQYISEKAQSELWLDGDEFGAKRKETAHLQALVPPSPLLVPSTPQSSKRISRRHSPPLSSSRRNRSRSPPPTPRQCTPPPPVPPVTSNAFATPGSKKAIIHTPSARKSSIQGSIPELALDPPRSPDRLRCAQAATGVTCFEYITLHNNSRGVAT